MRAAVRNLAPSLIREVANAGLGRDDVLPFWFGESDEVTPTFIREAAMASLERGETFYTHNLGLPELREAIAQYMSAPRAGQYPARPPRGTGELGADLRSLESRQHPPVGVERIAVTAGGVNGLMIAMQALVDPGDEVVVLTPVWPNLTAQPLILGARLRCVPLVPAGEGGAQWQLDLDALCAAITPATRLLVLNSPNNPTGWTLTAQEQQRLLEHCRRTGTWILADEVYERLYFRDDTDTGAAPSFLDMAAPDERLVVVHSFSKSFLMTGWRLGWLVLPAELTEQVGKLIEFNTSCNSAFTQRASVVALQRAAEVTPRLVAHLRACRDALVPQLAALPGVHVAPAPGGMYAFFRIDGHGDSFAVAKRLVAEAGLGLAPGAAFAAESNAWLRWCFASRDISRLGEGVQRLGRWLGVR